MEIVTFLRVTESGTSVLKLMLIGLIQRFPNYVSRVVNRYSVKNQDSQKETIDFLIKFGL